MTTLSANEAKTQFGEMLMQAQREPVHINRNGKPVAVVISAHQYAALEQMKNEFLRQKINNAKQDIAAGNLIEGEAFMENLLKG